jgi:hypothetical protein
MFDPGASLNRDGMTCSSSGTRAEQGVGGGAAGPLAVELGLHARNLGIEHLDALLQLGEPEQLQVLADASGAADRGRPDFSRFFHEGLPFPVSRWGAIQPCRTRKRKFWRTGFMLESMTEMMTAIAIEGGKRPPRR